MLVYSISLFVLLLMLLHLSTLSRLLGLMFDRQRHQRWNRSSGGMIYERTRQGSTSTALVAYVLIAVEVSSRLWLTWATWQIDVAALHPMIQRATWFLQPRCIMHLCYYSFDSGVEAQSFRERGLKSRFFPSEDECSRTADNLKRQCDNC